MQTADSNLENRWDFFPLIFCINLKERDDRFEEAKQELSKAGLNRVVFYRSFRQPDRDKAIVDAHMACLRYAVKEGAPYALIFEDDVLFQEGYQANLQRMIDLMKSRSDWNLFHLGGFIFRKVERVSPHIVRGGILTAHAYVIRTEFAKRVLEKRPYCSRTPPSSLYNTLNGDAAFTCIDPMICIQRPSLSDGSWVKKDINQSGWLGNAMIYTSLSLPEKLRFNRFSLLERLRIENIAIFLRIYRGVYRSRLNKLEKQVNSGRVPAITEYPLGEYQIVEFKMGTLKA